MKWDEHTNRRVKYRATAVINYVHVDIFTDGLHIYQILIIYIIYDQLIPCYLFFSNCKMANKIILQPI
jgi:hypothetical protein